MYYKIILGAELFSCLIDDLIKIRSLYVEQVSEEDPNTN